MIRAGGEDKPAVSAAGTCTKKDVPALLAYSSGTVTSNCLSSGAGSR
jgi:hypothetical protein